MFWWRWLPAPSFWALARRIQPRVTHKTASLPKPHLLNASSPANSDASHQRVLQAYGRLPLAFDANQGQTDPQVKYLARGKGYTLFLTSNKAVLSLNAGHSSPLRDAMLRRSLGPTRWKKFLKARARQSQTQMAVLDMEMVGANPHPQIAGEDALPGVTNYLIGNDPSKWHTKVPQYARVAYQGVYPGVDLAFHGEQQQLEFDFLVAPQADPAPIGLQFTGAKRMALDKSGNLLLTSAAGDVTLKKPVAYQEANGARQPVEAAFVVKDHGQVGLALGQYDRSRELVIDPSLNYATYLGGTGQDEGFGIALDPGATPSAYITGDTDSATFPGSPTPLGARTPGALRRLCHQVEQRRQRHHLHDHNRRTDMTTLAPLSRSTAPVTPLWRAARSRATSRSREAPRNPPLVVEPAESTPLPGRLPPGTRPHRYHPHVLHLPRW